jgi:hypothetical protein
MVPNCRQGAVSLLAPSAQIRAIFRHVTSPFTTAGGRDRKTAPCLGQHCLTWWSLWEQ